MAKSDARDDAKASLLIHAVVVIAADACVLVFYGKKEEVICCLQDCPQITLVDATGVDSDARVLSGASHHPTNNLEIGCGTRILCLIRDWKNYIRIYRYRMSCQYHDITALILIFINL
jgi:hypothetical protein